ncbi:MAG: hypothetical protein IKY79_09835 [Bacteroidales bacterium]|nr:hypothetical protein [Bacteroidales bacterium]
MGNSGFKRYSGSLHSPLLHYHYVSTSLTMQIPAETLSQTHRVCFMLLCYRFVTTTLTAQIPSGNAIANSQGLLHAETGFSYFGARYYDSDLMTGWLSVDPMADKYPGLSPYAYCAWNCLMLKKVDTKVVRSHQNVVRQKMDCGFALLRQDSFWFNV